jgi:hypothetical protein
MTRTVHDSFYLSRPPLDDFILKKRGHLTSALSREMFALAEFQKNPQKPVDKPAV